MSTKPAKASLVELDADYQEKNGGKNVAVQFNPETLKVSFANQIVQPNNTGSSTSAASTGDQSNQASRQFVGAGTTKLALQLIFDVTIRSSDNGAAKVVDVRELTKDVAYFITPVKVGDAYIPPAVRFLWGSFHFDGLVDSMEENLEFFSDEGLPLRATITMNLSQQKIEAFSGRAGGAGVPGAGGVGQNRGQGQGQGRSSTSNRPAQPAGTVPMTPSTAGTSLQAMAAARGGDWQSIAEANGIENPRLMDLGAMIDFNVRK